MTAAQQGSLLTIDLGAVADNTALFAQRANGRLMAVVKADGFGHGAVDVARTALAHGAGSLGVTSVEEALSLRDAGVAAPVLSWLNAVDADFEAAVRRGIDLAAPSVAHLHAIAGAAGREGHRADVHLQVDVGMARDGADPSDWAELCQWARILEQQGLVRVAGVMAHLGWADRPHDPANAIGRRTFEVAATQAHRRGLRPRVCHLAATAATLTDPRSHYDLCRVGAGLVGIDPSKTTSLRAAMTLTAPVVSIREVPAGTSVGYGHTHVTTRRTRLALLPLGYADGVPRSASGHGWVQLRGRRHPVVGLVSMDQIVVDVGSSDLAAGEIATIFGPGDDGEPTVADWADWAGTIEHEIVTSIGRRVARRVVPAPVAAPPSLPAAECLPAVDRDRTHQTSTFTSAGVSR